MSYVKISAAKKLILAEMRAKGILIQWVYPGDITIGALTLVIEHDDDKELVARCKVRLAKLARERELIKP
jgi:hypothetical protein